MITEKQFIKKLETRRAKIAAERDKLREMISDVEYLAETCDEAIDSIECAIESLSELL